MLSMHTFFSPLFLTVYYSHGNALLTFVHPQGYFGQLLFLYVYLALCMQLVVWFLLYTWCFWRDLNF